MIPPMRATALAPKWWMMVTRGALALAFGGAISLWPNPTLPFVVVLFASYAMLDGAWAIAAAVSVSQRGRWLAPWPVALGGAVSMVIGAAGLWWPSVPQTFVHMVVALLGLVTGALELLTAFALPRERAAHWLMGTGGICSISLVLRDADHERRGAVPQRCESRATVADLEMKRAAMAAEEVAE